jgi:hypothetical protein
MWRRSCYTERWRKNSSIWEAHSFGWGARRRTAVYVQFSMYTMPWLGEHRAFIVEEFIKNGGSLVSTQRAFGIRFRLVDGKLFLITKRFTVRYQTLDKRFRIETDISWRPRTAKGSETVSVVRASIQKSPRRPARKHEDELRLFDRSVRRILHEICECIPTK